MDPDEINKEAGTAVWKCWHCKAESGLHWWNGLSVAVCNKPECSRRYSEFLSESVEAEERLEQYARENSPWWF